MKEIREKLKKVLHGKPLQSHMESQRYLPPNTGERALALSAATQFPYPQRMEG